MSGAVVITTELDHLDQLGAKAFAGFLVRKDLVRKYSRQYPVTTYVVEFLLGRYCASTDPAEIEEGLQIVEKQLKRRTVRTGEEELFKARCRDQGSVKIIDIVRGPGSTPAAIPTRQRFPASPSKTPRSMTS